MKFFKICEKMPVMRGAARCGRWAAWMLCIAGVSYGQAVQAPAAPPHALRAVAQARTAHKPRKTSAAKERRVSLPVEKPKNLASSADAPAGIAQVLLKNRSLTVKADNSDLSQILKNIAKMSGMTIKGDVKSGRVFGIYGPGNPSDVLTDLLAGSGSNFIMIGNTPDGTPRELQLLPKNGSLPVVEAPRTNAAASGGSENSDSESEEEPPGPGAIIHVPPAGSEDPQVRAEQNLRRLQQMHDQQKQQEAPQ